MGNFGAFIKRCEEAFEAASHMPDPLIVHHYDADGITSGSLVASWFENNKKPFRMKCVRKLDPEFVQSLQSEQNIIFSDLGSGSAFVDELKHSVVIVDHHELQAKSHLQANPHLFGFDGGTELSASGCAYFVFRCSSDLGITGAMGDMQYPFISLNKKMLEEALEKGDASISTDLLLFGRNSRPLQQLLLYADEPYLPGLTGHADACAGFLSDLKIPLKDGEKWRVYNDMLPSEKTKFVSALAEAISVRASPEAAGDLVGEVITLLRREPGTELRDASEFSTLLNACGRNDRPQLGVQVCLSKPGAYEEAQTLLSEHKKNLRAGLEFAMKNTEDLGKFILLDARGIIPDSIVGVVAGMFFPGARKKPILALSLEDSGKIKLSARGTKKLVEQGLNLGKILAESCAAVGGVGGGHNIAAGATIPNGKLEEFLLEFSKRL